MTQLVPSLAETPDTANDDPRLGHLIGRAASAESAEAVILGFPSDEGVRINGGRPGAAGGPERIRKWLYRMTPDARQARRSAEFLERVVDLGDVGVTGDVLQDQEVLGELLEPYLKRHAVPIVLGGGHETAFGHFLGYVYSGRSVRIVNWDAHPDVRSPHDGRPHSGTPFHQAMRHASRSCVGYTAVGLIPHQTATKHLEFIRSNGGDFVWRDDVTEKTPAEIYSRTEGPVMASFDLDAVRQSEAPGVSAPSPYGLPVETWLRAAEDAGRSPNVTSIDVVELNPRFDVDDRTARLAALTVWSFLQGLAERRSSDEEN